MEIFKPVSSFDFNKITLANPQPLQGSTYFTKINYGFDNIPLYIQLPKCLTKQAVISSKRGKYSDLMYESGFHDEFIEWLEHLESTCQDKIDEKKQLWFQNEFTRDEIESMMTPIARMYKSGKYVLLRAYINENKHTGKDKCIVYNENEISVDLETINEETYIIPLILIDGIKFTSRSFEIDIKIIQIMVLDKNVQELTTCLIKKNVPTIKNIVKEENNTIKEDNNNSIIKEDITIIKENNPIKKEDNNIIKEEQKYSTNNLEINNTNSLLAETVEIFHSFLPKETIEEVNINYETIMDTVTDTIILKKPNEVYYQQFKVAKQKALEMRELAINAILEAKNIKEKYNLVVNIDDLLENF